ANRIPGLLDVAIPELRKAKLPAVTMYFELPPPGFFHSEAEWQAMLRQCLLVLARQNVESRSTDRQAGLKPRCRGPKSADVPSSSAVAAVICDCRNHAVFWKATAGLHHPLRHFDANLGVEMHGFLNLFVATVLSDVHHLDITTTRAILDDRDATHFRFED